MKFRLLFTVTLFLFIRLLPHAQVQPNAWSSLLNNDFNVARQTFLSTLASDSLNKEALEGMIVITEIFNDPALYQKYVGTYLRNYPTDATYHTFWAAYAEDFEKTSVESRLSESMRLEARMQLAIEASDKSKDYQKNLERYRQLFPLPEWNLIGPFKNVNGSGHIEVFPPEQDGFVRDTNYIDESGRTLTWINPSFTAGSGRLYLDQHLQDVRNEEEFTHFAHALFQLDKDGDFELRIGRSAPIKVWVNGHEVFSNNDRVRFNYDRERLLLKLPSGIHSLMIKVSSFNPLMDTYDLLEFFDRPSYNQGMIAVRFTDHEGALLKNISFPSNGFPSGVKPDFNSLSNSSDALVLMEYEKENRPFLEFAYCKALIRNGAYKEADAWFYEKYREHEGSAFYAYLYAKSIAFNGKQERAYPLMSALDHSKTPVFGFLFEKHKEIDLKTEPQRFFESLQFLNTLCPSARVVINNYISYYDSRAMKEEKDAYLNRVMEQHPEHREWLERQLSTYVPPREKFGAREELKEERAAIRRLKKGSADDDYEMAIDFYMGRKRTKKTLDLLKERIAMNPHVTSYRMELADYYVELEKYEWAQDIAREALTVNPFLSEAYELIGDCFEKRNKRAEALEQYKLSHRFEQGYRKRSIREKIEKIEGAARYKSAFDTPSFDEILAQSDAWKEMAKGEDAIVLMYTRDIAVNEYNEAEIYQKLMTLILTEAGANSWTESNFRYLGNITSIKVIRSDGSQNTPDVRNGVVVFKNLSPGDLIQIESRSEYAIEGMFDNELTLGHFLFYPNPVYYSKLEAALPHEMQLYWQTHKFEGEPDRFQKGNHSHYKWVHTFLPGIEEEDGAPDQYDLYRSIQLSTMADWSKLVTWYQRETYRRLEPSYEIELVLDTLIKSNMSEMEKVARVYRFITRGIKYSFVPFLNSRFVPKYPENTLSASIGDCKDVASLMIIMLRKLGIECYYTLVKSNHYHHLTPPPSLAFDHVIVCYVIDGKRYFTDLTTNYYPLQVLPEMDNHAVALLIKDGEKEIFRLPSDILDPEKTMIEIKASGVLKLDRSLELNVTQSESGVAAGRSREMITRTPPSRIRNLFIDQIGKDVFENLELSELKYDPLNSIEAPLVSQFTLYSNGYSDNVANLFILRIPWIRSIVKQPGITVEQRQNRIDLATLLDIRPSLQIVELTFPQGYSLTELPENMYIESRFGSYAVRFERRNNGIQVIKEQRFKQQFIETADFPEFRTFYLKLLDADKGKIAIQTASRR